MYYIYLELEEPTIRTQQVIWCLNEYMHNCKVVMFTINEEKKKEAYNYWCM